MSHSRHNLPLKRAIFDLLVWTIGHTDCAICCPSVDGLLAAGVLCYEMEKKKYWSNCTLQLYVALIFDKSKKLHNRYMRCLRSVPIFTAYARLCAAVLVISLYFTPLFNLYAYSPLIILQKEFQLHQKQFFDATILCSILFPYSTWLYLQKEV